MIVNDVGYPVYIHPDYEIMVVWNGRATFNLYREKEDGELDNYDIFLTTEDVTTVQRAEQIAKEHFAEMEGNEDE